MPDDSTTRPGSQRRGRTIWHVTISLDSFMADRDGSLAWFPTDAGAMPMGTDLVPRIGAILTGRRTHDTPGDGKPYGGAYTGPVFVLTHRAPPDSSDPSIQFVTSTLHDALTRARDAAGDQNVVVFGGDLGRQCLQAGELDEILIHIAPVLLGDGIPAFLPGEDGLRSFDVLERSGADDMTSLRLRPRNR